MKSMLRILTLLFLPMALSCASETVEKSSVGRGQSIQPRAEAAMWMYTSVYYENGKKEPNGITREDVIKVQVVDGQTCYLVKLTTDWRSLMDRMAGVKLSDDDYSYYWEYYNEQGSFNYTLDDGPEELKNLDGFELTMPYPVEAGKKYVADENDYEVIDTEAAISVKAGDFKCVVYQIFFMNDDADEDGYRERFYMSPGVGLVRWEMDAYVDGKWVLDMRDDLIKYDLKVVAATAEIEEEPAAKETTKK